MVVALASLCVLAGLAVTVTARSASGQNAALVVGTEAPEIRLGDQHGRSFMLSEALKQRAFVVLAFYPKAFTSG
jgi:AhpC/TSA family